MPVDFFSPLGLYCRHHHKTCLKKSSSCLSFEKRSPFEDALLLPWETSEMLQRKQDTRVPELEAEDGGWELSYLYFYCQYEIRTAWLWSWKHINQVLVCNLLCFHFYPDKLNRNQIIKRVTANISIWDTFSHKKRIVRVETFTAYFKCIHMLYRAGLWPPEILPETRLDIFRRSINSCGLEGGLGELSL